MNVNPPASEASAGGSGAAQPEEPATPRSELALIARAAHERWKIPAEVREKIMAVPVQIALRSKNERRRLAALRAIAALDRLNLDQERLERSIGKSEGGGPEEG